MWFIYHWIVWCYRPAVCTQTRKPKLFCLVGYSIEAMLISSSVYSMPSRILEFKFLFTFKQNISLLRLVLSNEWMSIFFSACFYKTWYSIRVPAGIYLFEVDIRNTRTNQWRRSVVFIVKILHIALVFPLLSLDQ